MTLLISYMIVSALYGFFIFYKHPSRDRISVRTQLAFGTTFPLHLIMVLLGLFYKLFKVNIFYYVTVDLESQDEGSN